MIVAILKVDTRYCIMPLISGLLDSNGKTFLETLVYKGSTKFVTKICVNS